MSAPIRGSLETELDAYLPHPKGKNTKAPLTSFDLSTLEAGTYTLTKAPQTPQPSCFRRHAKKLCAASCLILVGVAVAVLYSVKGNLDMLDPR